MNYDDYLHPIRRSPRAAHELRQVFEQLQLENNVAEYDQDEADGCSESDEDFPPPIPRSRVNSYNEQPATSRREPLPRSPGHVNPLRSHPVVAARTSADHTPAPAPAPAPAQRPVPRTASRYRFSHPLREQLCAPRLPDPIPRRHPTNLVSYKPANQRLHPKLRKRTSLDTIASVTTTASARDAEFDEPSDVETQSLSMFTLESDYPTTPSVDLGSPPMGEPLQSTSMPESLRTAGVDSTPSMPPTTPVTSTETHPPKGILRKLKPGKRMDSMGTDGGADKLVIERTVSVDQTSYRSNSSSASNTMSSGTPSRYPISEAGNSRSSSTWTASSHDISGLTPEELKKCKKKGINPALFAEMKAARKGKWTSPIAGNTFLA
ncbi:uncharacterized protein M421DRAFT_5113 [Didymella exigua CBS 183.55]|uniref:Uncharacterized protein n=1 Tax=Didymella exigua CBS 183.55 TaxID=1150837 RepID=A0A6A5RLI4_9PLEO|nr:uncharacterized protein M421DRAFT_5113 [Didymella exigua CBS 183.55]KAF1928652.1 hypothetical protein M421DRAFT_5113 [Didymella exigua CBS 183.55]